MGSSWSTVFSTDGTPETKQILNTILKRLITEVDMRDMYSLADPRMCKEYIVVATSALTKLFATIRIDKGPDGTLLFQKIKGLQEKNPDPQLQQQRCKELAFFFIRIFQIYAAISLSIMDSELPTTDPIEIMKPKEMRRKGVVFIRPDEGFKGFPQKSSGWLSGLFGTSSQVGGYLRNDRDGVAGGNFWLNPVAVGPYKILNSFLIKPNDASSRDAMMFHTSSGVGINMSIDQETLYDFSDRDREIKNLALGAVLPKIKYEAERGKKILEADMRCSETPPNFTIKLENIIIGGKPLAADEVVERTLTNRLGGSNPRDDQGKELPEVLQSMFIEVYDRVEPPIFSAAEFLRNKGILRSLEGIVSLEGTKLVTINPRDQKGERLKVVYKTRHKIDEDTVAVQISADLIIEKRKKTDIEDQKYFVKIDFNSLETKPEYLKDELNIPYYESKEGTRFRGKERYFSTGPSDSSRPVSEKGETISIFLETVFNNLLLKKDEFETRNGIKYTREGLPEPLDTSAIPIEMRIKELWKALAKDPPVKAHCVARALQLLSLSAIRGNETNEAFSSICRVKFPYAKDGSLPPAGQPITQEYGILSLAMLFVDKLVAGSPQITDTAQYTEFRKKFKFFFERYEQAQLDGIAAPDSLSKIDEKIMPMCKGHTRDRIKVEGGTVFDLRSKAMELLNRQASHVRNSMAILFKLFNERAVRSGKFEISEYVQRDGMAAVNQIAEETRNMLVEYYGDCEKTYKDGLFVLYNKHIQNEGDTKFIPVDTDAPAAPVGGGY